jgi:hypothetical protein
MGKLALAALAALVALVPSSGSLGAGALEFRSLDGGGNNVDNPTWGQAGTDYLRVTAPFYADGIAKMVGGPNPRYVSNRVFNDRAQNKFSENGVSQWGWLWGQFMDHTFGLRDERPGERAPIPSIPNDPLEQFRNDFKRIDFFRTLADPLTGVTTPRQQINTLSSYIDAFNVYGGTADRLAWLRDGPRLLLPDGYLPRTGARGNVATAPAMDLMGRLTGQPAKAVVAGDVRANENIALTAVHTLFAREHNWIVDRLPAAWPDELKFQVARRIVGAEEQYITYTQFLPAMGVHLPAWTAYDRTVNATLSNEFAVVGYRAHSQIHGEMEPQGPEGTWTQAQLDAFAAQGMAVGLDEGNVKITIPLNMAFGNPDLLQGTPSQPGTGVGPLLKGLALEPQYQNDEQIDNQLRSVLFLVPAAGVTDPTACLDGPALPNCFTGVVDLGAIDIKRGRDHGMPTYNNMRRAYGLAPKPSFAAITGESTSDFPNDPAINPLDPINDPHILDFVDLRDPNGTPIEPGSPAADASVVKALRRTTLAARLKAIYVNVSRVDAFVGMVSEPRRPGSELGELQLAMWTKQFQALRDGDRFYYENDTYLNDLVTKYPLIDFHKTLAQIIERNTDATDVPADVFHAAVPLAGDTTPPTNVAVTSPVAAATVGSVTQVLATASDDVGVDSVQFILDGNKLGAAVKIAPYSLNWDTTAAANGPHTLAAVASDAAGNTTKSADVPVTVSNVPAGSGGLVAAYSFDESGGAIVKDASGSGNDGTLTNATRAPGKHGSALSFNGTSAFVSVADSPSLDLTTGMTLEAWVNPDALGTTWRTVVFKTASAGMVYSLYANRSTTVPAGQVNIGGEQNANGTAALPLNTWSHLAATFDGGSLRLYVNGSLVATRAVAGPVPTSTGALRLGGNSIWGEFYSGLIDDVRVYNRALSQTQLQADMAAGVGGGGPVPVAAFSFDEGAGPTAHDTTGHGNDGTTANTAWAAGKYGGALSFNGTSSWVTVADAPTLDLTTASTLEAWVKPDALGATWRTVIFKATASGMVFSLYANQAATRPVAQVNIGGEQNAIGPAALPLNAWAFLAATYDGATLRLYVDGVLVSSRDVAGAIPVSTGPLRIGGNAVWPEWYSGLIDNVRVYDRALSQEELQTDMVTAVG